MTDAAPSTALTAPEARQRPPALHTGGAVGALVPQTLEEAFRLANAMAASGMTPRDIDTTEKVLVAIMAGAELGMKPFQAVQSFAIVNGRPSLWGDGLMALALTNGLDVEEWQEGEGDQRIAYCRVTRPDNGKVVVRHYSVDMAKTAKLWGKVSANGKPSPWVTGPDRMLQMRARSFAIRDAAADVLRGMPIKEEIEDFIEANPGIMDRQDESKGTGLLAKLETAQTLTAVAAEGFGVRNLADEAGGASPEAEPKPKARRTRKTETDEALNKAGEELAAEEAAKNADEALAAIAEAEPDVVETTTADHADAAEDAEFEADAGTNADQSFGELAASLPDRIEPEPLNTAADPENLPADAQVEETAALTSATVINGPAPADVVYFLAEAEAFPSGRRAVWFNGLPNGVEDASEPHPTYTEHAPAKAEAPEAAAFDDAPGELATEAKAATPPDVFHEAIIAATTADELVAALKALFASGEVPNPDAKRIPRIRVWSQARALNEDGAKIAPESDPYILSCYIEAETDPEAVQAMLPLASDTDWFKAGGPAMQTGVSRAIMDRVAALTGG